MTAWEGREQPSVRQGRALTEVDAAEALGLKVATLRAWRHSKKGPQFVKFGRAVRYLVSDLDAFVEASRVDTHRMPSATVVADEGVGRAA